MDCETFNITPIMGLFLSILLLFFLIVGELPVQAMDCFDGQNSLIDQRKKYLTPNPNIYVYILFESSFSL